MIAEDHGLNRDGRTLQIFEMLDLAIGARPFAHPGEINRLGRGAEILTGIVGGDASRFLDCLLMGRGEPFQSLAIQVLFLRHPPRR